MIKFGNFRKILRLVEEKEKDKKKINEILGSLEILAIKNGGKIVI